MATEGQPDGRAQERVEETFDAMTTKSPSPGSGGNPWKLAAWLLLLAALAMPLFFGIRASRWQIDRDERIEAAEDAASALEEAAESRIRDLGGELARAKGELAQALSDAAAHLSALNRAVELAGQRAEEDSQARMKLEQGLRSARLALEKGSAGMARQSLGQALSSARLGSVEEIIAGIRHLERRESAKKLEAIGEPGSAAALYRVIGMEQGDDEALGWAHALEKRIRRDDLLESLGVLAKAAEAEEDFASAAALIEAVGRVAGNESSRERARSLRARWLLTRAEAALADGAARYALSLLEGVEAPRDLLRRIDAELRREALTGAGAALQRGRADLAFATLKEAGLLDREEAAPLAARTLLRLGEVEAGLARLPEDPEVRTAELRRAGVALLESDPSRAGVLLLKAREIADDRPDLTAALALALEAAGHAEDAKTLWEQVRAAALTRSN